MSKRTLLAASITAAIIGISGCSSSHSPDFDESIKRVENSFEGGFGEQVKRIQLERDSISTIHKGVNYHDVNDYTVEVKDERKLPSNFDQPSFIKDDIIYTIDEFAALLYRSYGIVLDVSSPDLALLAEEQNDSQLPTLPAVATPNQGINADSSGDFNGVIDLIADKNKPSSRDGLNLKPFTFKDGSVREMLDYVSILNGLKWNYDPKFSKAYLYVNETREFTFYDFGDDIEVKSTTSTATTQDAESTSSASQKEVKRQQQSNFWDDIEETINSMLSPEIGKAAFNHRSGKVVVTDNDYALSRINNFVDNINNDTMKEITVQYSIIRLTYDEETNKGINQSYLNNSLQNNLLGSFDLSYGSGSLASDINGNLGSFQELFQGNFFSLANSSQKILMGFLNTIGTAEIAYENQVPIMNNDTFTHQGGTNEEYIAGIERSSISTGVGQENVTTERDVAVDGLNIIIQPKVAGDEISLRYDVSTSDIIGINDAGGGSSLEGVKLRKDRGLDLGHKVKLQNGIPRVIQFIHEKETKADSQGIGDHALWFLGGNENKSSSKSAIIVTMTAYYNN